MLSGLMLGLTLLLLVACWLDVTRFIIPNWLNGLIVALYPLWVLFAPHAVDWLSGIGFAALLFVVGLLLHRFRLLGGGDVKLLVACGFYTGFSQAAIGLLMWMGLLGGALALLLLVLRPMIPPLANRLRLTAIPRVLSIGEPVPYGLAIAGAFLLLLWQRQLPGMV